MKTIKKYNGDQGIYHYICPDVDSAMAKMQEIEEIMDFWLEQNPDHEYSTCMLFGETGVIIELKIFI